MSTDFPYSVVLSHGPCLDGTSAAWVYWRTLPDYARQALGTAKITSPEEALQQQRNGVPVVFGFTQHTQPVPAELVAGQNVLIMDLDLGNLLRDVLTTANFVTLIDHHDSTSDTLSFYQQEFPTKFYPVVNVSTNESAATLAWKFFYPHEYVPDILQIVRIKDNWAWNDMGDLEQLHPRETIKGMQATGVFKSLTKLEQTYTQWSDQTLNKFYRIGRGLVKCDTATAQKLAQSPAIGWLQTNDGRIYTVAYVQTTILHSDTAMLIRNNAHFRQPIHFTATWKYNPGSGIVNISFRDPAPGINLSRIARSLRNVTTGGGHANAASIAFYGIENFHKFLQRNQPI